MIINYEYYQIFYYVAKNKNITEAANQLFLSQSTVSRTIQNLERDLGCTLLIRSKQGLSLTEEGQFLYEYVEKAFAFITMAECHLSNVKDMHQGILRLGGTELTLQYYLLPYIQKFESLYPNIHIEFDFEYPKSAIRNLNEGLLDVAVLTSPFEYDDAINYHLLAEVEMILIAGKEYFRYEDRILNVSDLAQETFILMKDGTSARTHADSFFKEYGVNCFPKYETGSTPLIISMVEQNMGLGIVPRAFAKEKLAQGSIVELCLECPIPPIGIFAQTSKLFPINIIRDKFLAQLKQPMD